MNKIIIGKNTLESLTSGMYADSFVIYREFIQNAVDSIDNAYHLGVLSPGQEAVVIKTFESEGRIEISDNGLGISANESEQVLTSIGNSNKDINLSRGFRGIGRLVALSYCQNLIFETSYLGEKTGSRIIIDASKLTKSLVFNNKETDVQADTVMESVCLYEQFPATNEEHYFRVIMKGIDNNSDLLKQHFVIEYLEQVAPVPFNIDEFEWGEEIIKRMKNYGYQIPQYHIFFQNSSEIVEIFKPYHDKFLVDKTRNTYDAIQDISIYKLINDEGKNIAIVWIAQSNFIGTIIDKAVKGLRIRKGNILIGDGQTLNMIFKDARLNGWTLGEVFVLDPTLIPNARRDNFEKLPSYFEFTEKMTALAYNITKQIRNSSLQRNFSLLSVMNKTEKISSIAQDVLAQDVLSPHDKGVISQKLHATQKEVESINTNKESESLFQEIAFDQLDILIGKVQGATKYKSINVLTNLSKSEKKILERVFFILQNQLSESDLQRVIDAILEGFIEKSEA